MMHRMESIKDLLRNRVFLFSKLVEYGFTKVGGEYQFETPLIEKEMHLVVSVAVNGEMKTKVVDQETKEEYISVKISSAVGEYVGKVRNAYQSKLKDIILNCTDYEVFQTQDAKKIISYIRDQYKDSLEFLWEKLPEAAIFRNKKNQKWYALLMKIPKNRLGLEGEEMIEVINLKISSDKIEYLVDQQKYFLAYHMNKKHWITIVLDNGITIEELYHYVDDSYHLSK